MAEVRWSRRANQERIAVLAYGAEEFGTQAAQRLNARIEDYTRTLSNTPLLGAVEPLLQERCLPYSSLVVHKHYKLIYRIAGQVIYIVDLWDTRREPELLARRIRSKRKK